MLRAIIILLGIFLLSESVYATQLPYCPIYDKPTRVDYDWFPCEYFADRYNCTQNLGCSWDGQTCWGEFLYPVAFGVPDCESISAQAICTHRMGCEWVGGVCQNTLSSPACIPVSPLDANLRFEALKDGSYACIFSAKTHYISTVEPYNAEETFDPFTTDGVDFSLDLTTPGADGSTSSQHFSAPANYLVGTKRYEFHKVMTADEVNAIRMNSVFQSGGMGRAPQCTASFGTPEQSSGVLFQVQGGGLQCECPEEFIKMLESYNLGGLYELYDHLATANAVANVSDACAPGMWKRLSRLPIAIDEYSWLSQLYPESCGFDYDPSLNASYWSAADWNTCWSSNPTPSQRFASRSTNWLRACMDRQTQPTYRYDATVSGPQRVVTGSKPSFPSELEKDLGVYHFQYLMKQVEVTQAVNEEHLKIARRIIQTMEVEPPMFAATSINRYIPAESLATAQQVYQRIQIAETIWSLLPETQWDHFQHDLNRAELMAYLESPANPVVAATAHWPQHSVPQWKLNFFEQSCEGGFYCGMDVDPRASFSVLAAKLLQMMRAEEDAVEQVKLQMPWMAGVVDEIVSRARRDMSGSTYVNGVFIKSPYPPNLVGAPPSEDWYKSRLKPQILSFYRAQLPELERLQANLVKMKASLTCSTPANRLSASEFDATMRTLIDVPAKSRESYRKCYARDQIWNVAAQTMEPVCKTYEGKAADGDYCYCEGSGLSTIDQDMTRQVSRDQIEWRITAMEKILSQRNWAKDLSEINGMIKATGWMALTTIFGPGAFQIGISALARTGMAIAQLSKTAIAGALTSELRGLQYFGSKSLEAYKLVRMGQEPAMALLKYSGYVFDAAAYVGAGWTLGRAALGYCESTTEASSSLGSAAVDIALNDYLACIRAAQYAVSALRFTGVVNKFTQPKVGARFKMPAGRETKKFADEFAVARWIQNLHRIEMKIGGSRTYCFGTDADGIAFLERLKSEGYRQNRFGDWKKMDSPTIYVQVAAPHEMAKHLLYINYPRDQERLDQLVEFLRSYQASVYHPAVKNMLSAYFRGGGAIAIDESVGASAAPFMALVPGSAYFNPGRSTFMGLSPAKWINLGTSVNGSNPIAETMIHEIGHVWSLMEVPALKAGFGGGSFSSELPSIVFEVARPGVPYRSVVEEAIGRYNSRSRGSDIFTYEDAVRKWKDETGICSLPNFLEMLSPR